MLLRCTVVAVLVTLATACGADYQGPGDQGGNPGDPEGGAALEIVSPVSRSVVRRETLGSDGRLFATANYQLTVLRADVVRVEVYEVGGELLAETNAAQGSLQWDVNFTVDGHYDLEWRAYDSGGNVIGGNLYSELWIQRAQVECLELLDLYQLSYTLGPSLQGVPDPVTVATPINGIHYRFRTDQDRRSDLEMDCQLAASLAEAAPYLRDRDIVEVVDIGVYNYRCIGGGTPPCSGSISQHAYARALDIHALVASDGTTYSVLDDWVIDGDTTPTCQEGIPVTDKNTFLHDFICQMSELGVWKLILTPNYDAAHRDHFHVDLSPGSGGIRSAGTPGVIDFGAHAH